MNRRNALRNTGLLIGSAIGMPSMMVLLNSCQSQSRLDWAPEFFTATEANCISTLVDTILPRTDTPGALDVKVDVFIDKLISKAYDEEGKASLKADIAAFNDKCKAEYGAVFAELSEENKVAFLTAEEQQTGKFSRGVWGMAVGPQEQIGFYRSMKSLAIWAYFSSEKIGKEVLTYDPVPGDYKGCIPVSEVGNRYSL